MQRHQILEVSSTGCGRERRVFGRNEGQRVVIIMDWVLIDDAGIGAQPVLVSRSSSWVRCAIE